MTGKEQIPDISAIDQNPPEVTQPLNAEDLPPSTFFSKFSHDWSLILASALAYTLLTTVFSISLVFLCILGIILGILDPHVQDKLIIQIQTLFPHTIVSGNALRAFFHQLTSPSAVLEIIVILLAIFIGSHLFIVIEKCFNLIYRLRPRSSSARNLIAIGMMLLLIVLTPIMVFASSLSTIALALMKNTSLAHLHNIGLLLSLTGVLGSLIAAIILFQAIYMIIPHQRITFARSWPGTLAAAGALQIYLAFLPLYITRFLGSYLGQIGFAVILLVFFYYFGLILLLGAEINAFYSEGIQDATGDLTPSVYSGGVEPTH
ncbi:MAG TPA: YihY/virulence factor BrkB family protein [Ktedonobacteraceae bacterium]